MAVYLDEQLDDEPMFGNVARYLEMSPSISMERVIKLIYGENTRASLLGRNYSHVAAETQSCWGLASREIINRMTLFPYVSRFLNEDASNGLIGQMLVSKSEGKTRGSWPALGNKGVRFCMRCLAEDLEQQVPKHWRRTHQLPGVIICVHHMEFLWMHAVGEVRNFLSFITPEVARAEGVSPLVQETMDVRKDAALQYAKLSHDLLNERMTIDRRCVYEIFKENIINKIRYRDVGELRKSISLLIDNCFGDDYLRCVGYRESIIPDLTGRHGFEAARVLWIVIFATMLELIDRDPSLLDDCDFKAVYGDAPLESFRRKPYFRERPPVECPNTLAGHGAGHIVERTAWRDSTLQCACTCGMRFRCDELDVGIGPPQITRWGETYVQEVMRLRSAGYNPSDISKMLGLPVRTAFNIYSALSTIGQK
jgi:hypothetical protein